MSFNELKREYKKSLKSLDTEEHIDLYFYRPLGFAWAKLFARLGVKPNAVTIASIFLGVAGGLLLYFAPSTGLRWLNFVGMLLIVWANSYDSADGQLARLTGQYSRLGRILDGLSGDFWFVTIYFTLVFRELGFGDSLLGSWFCYGQGHNWVLWAMAVAAGLCHAKQAAAADYYRQFHLYFLKGEQGSELDSSDQLAEQYGQLTWGHDFMKKLVLMFYLNYTRNQEALTPAMQRLRKALRQRFGNGPVSAEFRIDFRRESLPLMKYTNILSFNWRIITCFVAVAINAPWLYFAAELVIFNSLLVYMIVTHERKCRRLLAALQAGKY